MHIISIDKTKQTKHLLLRCLWCCVVLLLCCCICIELKRENRGEGEILGRLSKKKTYFAFAKSQTQQIANCNLVFWKPKEKKNNFKVLWNWNIQISNQEIMASEIELGIETLKISLDRQNPAETLRHVEHIVQPFADYELTGPENGNCWLLIWFF